VQISAFTFDHSLLNEFTFKFGGPEYQPLIRKQVEHIQVKQILIAEFLAGFVKGGPVIKEQRTIL
jgi:hypothetical protein